MNIQVLWVDDEFKQDFVGLAELEGVDIHHRKSAQEGIDELQKNLNQYHAVILDAKGILNREDQKTSLDGLRTIRDYLKELNGNHYLPHFIFTGQPDYQTNEIFKESFGEFFTKGKDEQVLIDKIKEEVLNKSEFVVHKNYSKVFKAVKELLDADTHSYLTSLLVSINKPKDKFDDKLHFTQIRIILESLFRVANKNGLLHDKCIANGKVNLSESSLFLAGEATKYAGVSCLKSHFPKIIADGVRDIIFITGAASHTSDPEIDKNINLKEYRSQISTPYLLFSLTFQLMDVIIWFNAYLIEHSDYQINKSFWLDNNEGKIVSGIVTAIAENGYGTFLPDNAIKTISIIPQNVKEFDLFKGQKIKVKTEQKGDKTHIIHIEI